MLKKSRPSFYKIYPKSSLTSLTWKAMLFITALKATKHLAYFCNKVSWQEIPKIAQSGQTDSHDGVII